MTLMTRRIISLAMLLLCLTQLVSCKRQENGEKGKLQVVATLFPVYDFARTVGGERGTVTLLLPPGVEPHSFEPKPEEIARVQNAAIFIYTDRWMEPWAGSLLKGVPAESGPLVVEAGEGATFLPLSGTEHNHQEGEKHDGDGLDPHIWLDPANAKLMVDNIAAAFAKRDPAGSSYYTGNAERLKREITQMDENFKKGLSGCGQRTFLHGGHYAFGYLAHHYGLNYLSAYAVTANAEPTPQRMAELVSEMRRRGLNTIFYEELLSPKVAETIARETGAELLKLHGIHNVTKDELDRGVTYVSLMAENLKNLRAGLQCR